MPKEIERKFLVTSPAYREGAHCVLFRQGYLLSGNDRVVRVRMCGEQAFLTIKGGTVGITRSEFEYAIPLVDAEQMLSLFCRPHLVEKYRYQVACAGSIWEVDEFLGDNEGLVVAEIELESEDEPFVRPPWLGREVSGDPRYYNNNLLKHPYREWKHAP
jgi:adenylate cyclase